MAVPSTIAGAVTVPAATRLRKADPGLADSSRSSVLKAVTAVLDQACFAGAHFAVNILLARWLPPAEYGAFAVAYSAYLLLDAAYHALISEPLLVFGAGQLDNRFRPYLGTTLKLHAAATLLGSLVIGLAGAYFWTTDRSLARAFWGAALAAPAILLLWLGRRAHYARHQPGRALIGAGLYLLVVLAGMLGLGMWGSLSVFGAFLVMGMGAALAAIFLLFPLRPVVGQHEADAELANVAQRHWSYGRWILASMVFSSIGMNCYYFFLPLQGGLQASAAFRALVNLTNPVFHALVGISSLLIPVFARIGREQGYQQQYRTVRLTLWLLASLSAVFLALLWVFGGDLMDMLYAGSYRDYASWPLLLVGMSLVPTSSVVIAGCALRSNEETRRVFWAFTWGAIAAVAVGVPLAEVYGVAGAAAGLLFTQALTGACMWALYRQSVRRRSNHA